MSAGCHLPWQFGCDRDADTHQNDWPIGLLARLELPEGDLRLGRGTFSPTRLVPGPSRATDSAPAPALDGLEQRNLYNNARRY